MPKYMVQASYSTGSVGDLIANPQDRSESVRTVIERTGGKLESFHYAFGEYDVVAIAEMPDNVSMAALSMAIAASGTLSSFKTTVLLTMDEAVEAMRKAGATGYQPPSR